MLKYYYNLDLINCAAICFLSYLLRESPEYFFDKTRDESKNNQPRIVVVGTDFSTYDFIANEECAFDIKIEDTTKCRCNDFVRPFLAIIALRYVFNVTYSKYDCDFYTADLARDSDNQMIPPKVLSLICRIKKLVS